jgi:hypothetical protein
MSHRPTTIPAGASAAEIDRILDSLEARRRERRRGQEAELPLFEGAGDVPRPHTEAREPGPHTERSNA